MCLQVLGAHMVGPDSAEIMQGIAIALKAGAKKVLPFQVHFKESYLEGQQTGLMRVGEAQSGKVVYPST